MNNQNSHTEESDLRWTFGKMEDYYETIAYVDAYIILMTGNSRKESE